MAQGQPSLFCDDPLPRRGYSRHHGATCVGDAGKCPHPGIKRGLCQGHYNRIRRGQDTDSPLDHRRHNGAQARQCRHAGCVIKPVSAKSGYCPPHQYRVKHSLPMDLPVQKKPRVTADDIRTLAVERGGECLDPENYANPDTQLRWRCSAGHEWQAPWNGVKYGGSWCPACAATPRKSERICRRVIELMFGASFPTAYPEWLKRTEVGRGLELDGYNEELKIAFEHNGLQHYEAVGYFEQGKVERTIERDRIKAKLCWQQGVALIIIPQLPDLNDVENIVRTIEFAVSRAGLKEARGWKQRRPTLIDQIWVPSDNPILTAIQKAMDERGWKCLSTYVDSATSLRWQCSVGHVWKATWNAVAKRMQCLKCRRPIRPTMCQAPGCRRPIGRDYHNFCYGHEKRHKAGQDMTTAIKETQRNTSVTCTAPGCQNPTHSHDLCTGHYKRLKKGQDITTPIKPFPPNRGKTIHDAYLLAKKKGGLCLSTTYQNSQTHLLWQCAEGHQWLAPFGRVAGSNGHLGGTWCAQCLHISRRTSAEIICSIEGCARAAITRGVCGLHYSRLRHGKPLIQHKDRMT